jgi:hypothetical protein
MHLVTARTRVSREQNRILYEMYAKKWMELGINVVDERISLGHKRELQ